MSTTGITLISFGYLHGPAPAAHITIDVRDHFRDPHLNPALRCLDGHDPRIQAAVLATPGVQSLTVSACLAARAYLAGPSSHPVAVAIGCAGGRHRSAVIAEEVARRLRAAGIPAAVTHRDITRPVVERRTT